MDWISGDKGRLGRWAWFAMPWLVATSACSDHPPGGGHEAVADVRLAVPTCDGSPIVVGAGSGFTSIESALSCLARRRLTSAVEVVVRPGVYQPFLNSGSPKQTAPLVIDHPEAAHITLRGESRLDIELSAFNSAWPVCCEGATCGTSVCDDPDSVVAYYGFKYNLPNAHWLNLKASLQALPPEQAEAYALIRRTRPFSPTDGLNHAIHEGVWKIDIPATLGTRDRLVVHLKYRPQDPVPVVPTEQDTLPITDKPGGLAPLPIPNDAEFSATTPPLVSIFTSVLKFNCSAGIVVDATTLKEIKNLVVVGDYDAAQPPAPCIAEKRRANTTKLEWSQNFAGINVQRGGGLNLSYVGISSMDGQGVSVFPNSWLVADKTAASGNERRGFYPTFTGAADLTETIASANHTDGYVVDHTAFAKLSKTLAVGNTQHGYNTMFGSTLVVSDSIASHNGQAGFASKGGGKFWFETSSTSSDAFRNQSIGLHSEIGGDARVASLRLEDNDIAGDRLGIRFDLGSTYSLDDCTLDEECNIDNQCSIANHDRLDVCDATDVTHPSSPPLARAFFRNKQLYVPARDATLSPLNETTSITIDPEGAGARSLHDFFNVPGPYSIAGKRVSLGDFPPSENYLTVKFGAGVFPYTDHAIVIAHPDARRVRIRGESCAVRVRSTMLPLNNCAPDPVPEELRDCREVKIELSDNDCEEPIKVGEFFVFRDTDHASADHPHWVHRGVWQVSAVGVNGMSNRLKLRNFSGAATEGAHATDQSGAGMAARVLRTILYFPDSTPGIIVDGTTLGSLEHVVLVGSQLPLVATTPAWSELTLRRIEVPEPPALTRPQCTAYPNHESLIEGRAGVKVQNCGHAYYDTVAVTGFPQAGIRVANNSTLLPWPFTDGKLSGPLVASANGMRGIVAVTDGTIWAKDSIASANLYSGYYVSDGGAVYGSLSASTANKSHGYEVLDNGYLEAGESGAVRNGQNGVLVSAARFTAANSDPAESALFAENGINGCQLEANAYAALNGAWSIGNFDETGAPNIGINVTGGSKCRCTAVTLQNNYISIQAKDGSLVSAGDAVCQQNVITWLFDASSTIAGSSESCAP